MQEILKKECMGIVNQLFDLAEVPVEKRQTINDKADEYLQEQILRLFAIRTQTDRKLLCSFFKYFRDNGEANIGMSIEQFVDAFLYRNSALTIKTMEQAFVFIYAKGNEIKVLNIEESKRLNDELLKEGWKHTQTLDACVWIQYLHNDCKDVDLYDEVKSLSKVE